MQHSKSENFYNEISFFYDDMINFETSLEKRKDLIRKFIGDDDIYAADLGCGSGLDSIALTALGLNVTGFDISENMLAKAKENTYRQNFNIEFVKTGLDKIPSLYNKKFDVVFSLGNTFANLTQSQTAKAIRNVSKMLKDGGKFVFQILNYSCIIKRNEKIVNINCKDGFTFIRYYDFHPDHINFNFLRFKTLTNDEWLLLTTPVYPHNKSSLFPVLQQEGFRQIKLYGSIYQEKFKKLESKDLVITAKNKRLLRKWK